MRKLIRKILKEDFEWVRDVVKKEYPIKLEVLMDYFGHDSMNPNESLDGVDNYGELECYSLENNERWCVGTVDEAYKEFRGYYDMSAQDGEWDLSDYTSITEEGESNFIENEPYEYIMGNVAYHDDDEENVEDLLEFLEYNNEDGEWSVDDVEDLTDRAIEKYREGLVEDIQHYGDLYNYLIKELGYKHVDIVRYFDVDENRESFIDDMTASRDYSQLFGYDHHETEFNGVDYILIGYE